MEIKDKIKDKMKGQGKWTCFSISILKLNLPFFLTPFLLNSDLRAIQC